MSVETVVRNLAQIFVDDCSRPLKPANDLGGHSRSLEMARIEGYVTLPVYQRSLATMQLPRAISEILPLSRDVKASRPMWP